MSLEICKMLTISTAHLTVGTRESLDAWESCQNGLPVFFPKGEHGWFVHVSEFPEDDAARPADLAAVIRFARSHGCGWVAIDVAGEPVDGLELFEELEV